MSLPPEPAGDEVSIARQHVWRPASGHASATSPDSPPLLLLHGTGGDEHDLVPLADQLSPGSAVLSPRGAVLEAGRYLRFFRRRADGIFDEDDIRERVDALAAFVEVAERAYDVRPGTWIAVGFSNGANTAAAMLLRHPSLLAGAALFAVGMPPFTEPPAADLTGRRVVIANGRRDPLAVPAATAALANQFRERGAEVSELPHPGGHAIDTRQLPAIAAALGLG